MCGDRIYSQLDERRGNHGCQQQVDCRGRHPHSEQDRHESGKDQQQEQAVFTNGGEDQSQGLAKTGAVEDCDNNPGHCTDDDDFS